tara:strand:+ start:221 stop:3001 length:2781 start_codon:yes stop_codon:yes gene_type:complete
VAYRADIEIGVKGARQLQEFRKNLENANNVLRQVNDQNDVFGKPLQSLKIYRDNLRLAAENLDNVKAGIKGETEAVRNYLRAAGELNQFKERQNRLLDEEAQKLGLVTQKLKEYNAAAVPGRQPGGSMAGRYLRPGSAVATTQSPVPFGPAPGVQFGSTTQFGPVGGPSSSVLGGQSSFVGDRVERSLRAARELDEVYASIDRIAAKSVATENERVQALGKGTQEVVELANSYRNISGQAKTQKQLQNEIRRGIIETKRAASEEARIRSRDYLERLRLAEGLGQERRNALLLASREEETERRINAVLERRRKEQERLKVTQRQRRRFTEDLALGAGFPLLFGGGAGAVLGGVAGAVAGGGKGGFGLQILLSAIGQQFDKLAQSAKELGQALTPLTADVEKVLEAAGTAGTESGELARRLQEAGEEQLALAVATEDLARVVGLDGVDALRAFASQTSELNIAINKLVLDVQVQIAKLANAAIALTGTPEQREVRESVDQARGLIRSGKASPELIEAFNKRTSGTDITGAFGAITQAEKDIVRLVREANNARLEGLRIETQRAEKSKQIDQARTKTAGSKVAFESFNRQVKIFELGNSLLDERVVNLKKEDIIARGNADTQALALQLEKVRGDLSAEESLKLQIKARNRKTDLELAQLGLSVQQATAAETERAAQAEERLRRLRERDLQRAAQKREAAEAKEARTKASIITELSNRLALERAIATGTEEQVKQQQEIERLVAQTDESFRPIIENYFKLINAQKDFNKGALETKRLYESIKTTIREGLVDGIMAAVDGTRSLSESLSGILKQLGKMFLSKGIGNFSTDGKGGSGLLGLLPFADGGRPPVGRPSIVGERGPELFVPRSSGTIIPNHQLGGGTTNVVVNVDAKGTAAQGDDAQAGQLGRLIGAAVQAELVKQKRPGGLLTR